MLHGDRALTALAALLALACQRGRPQPTPAATSTQPSSSASAASPVPSAAPSAKSMERDETLDAGTGGDAAAAEAAELSDIGPAGPASATSRGVVLITRDDQVLLAALSKKPKTPIDPVQLDAGAFAPFARGPAIAGDFAYWISKGRLVSRKITGGNVEVLAEDARDGTRVAAAAVGGNAVVAYIARPTSADGDAMARLWVAGADTLRLSPEGAAASSVALVETSHGAMALTLEGRTGMTPVHARQLKERSGKVALDEDVVVWVGGSAQTLTEVVAGESPSNEVWAFVAIERDVTRFGLAAMEIGERPKMGAPVTWRIYPNGLDPALLATTRACDQTLLAYTRPAEARPGAPQELHLASLGAEGLGAAQVVARSRAFANVSLAAVPDGTLVVYTADHRTWAARLRCTPKK